MTTRIPARVRIAAEVGKKPMTLERVMRALADANMFPKGSPGKPLHLRAPEFGVMILSEVAGQPFDAPEVVRVLSDLRADDNGERLIDWLTAEIEWAAAPEGAAALQAELSQSAERGVTGRDLTLCAGAAPYAWISTLRLDGSGRDIRAFHPVDRELIASPPRSVRHMTTIGIKLILVAGELLADTLAREPAPTLIPDPAPGSAGEGEATPETTKATGPGSHSGLHVERSGLAHQTGPLDKAQSNAGEGDGQPLPKPAVRESRTRQQHRRLSTNSHRSTAREPHWNDAAAP